MTRVLIFLTVSLFWAARSARAIVPGQIDTFEDGTLMGWANGVPEYLTNVTGGPGGPGDHYLRLIADGVGQGGRLTTFNINQWLGNYIAASVTAIALDLRNEGATSLSIRLAFKLDNNP